MRELYYLPIVYKPHYNIKKAFIITNALFRLLKSIEILNEVDFINKMGAVEKIIFNRTSKEIIKSGNLAEIKTGSNSINTPFYEYTLKDTKSIFTLRNTESVKLLTEFFDLQFSRAKISAIKFSNIPTLTNIYHFVVEHSYLKSSASLNMDRNKFINGNKFIDINPFLESYHNYALFPSVLMLRLTLNDLQNLKKLQFEWINN